MEFVARTRARLLSANECKCIRSYRSHCTHAYSAPAPENSTHTVRLASSGTVDPSGAGGEGTGYTIYSNSFLLTMVPHSVITVSLATAMLPLLSRYAADGDHRSIGRLASGTLVLPAMP